MVWTGPCGTGITVDEKFNKQEKWRYSNVAAGLGARVCFSNLTVSDNHYQTSFLRLTDRPQQARLIDSRITRNRMSEHKWLRYVSKTRAENPLNSENQFMKTLLFKLLLLLAIVAGAGGVSAQQYYPNSRSDAYFYDIYGGVYYYDIYDDAYYYDINGDVYYYDGYYGDVYCYDTNGGVYYYDSLINVYYYDGRGNAYFYDVYGGMYYYDSFGDVYYYDTHGGVYYYSGYRWYSLR